MGENLGDLEDIEEHNEDAKEEERNQGSYPCMGKGVNEEGCLNIIQHPNSLCNICYIIRVEKQRKAMNKKYFERPYDPESEEDASFIDIMTKDELIKECHRRRIVTEKIWAGIMSIFGQEAFIKILQYVKARKYSLGEQLQESINKQLAQGGEWKTPIFTDKGEGEDV